MFGKLMMRQLSCTTCPICAHVTVGHADQPVQETLLPYCASLAAQDTCVNFSHFRP